MSDLDDIFGQIAGEQIPGGCDMCDAYQSLETLEPLVHVLHVHHDDNCPILLASRSRSN
jgi:hypothetical protein